MSVDAVEPLDRIVFRESWPYGAMCTVKMTWFFLPKIILYSFDFTNKTKQKVIFLIRLEKQDYHEDSSLSLGDKENEKIFVAFSPVILNKDHVEAHTA